MAHRNVTAQSTPHFISFLMLFSPTFALSAIHRRIPVIRDNTGTRHNLGLSIQVKMFLQAQLQYMRTRLRLHIY